MNMILDLLAQILDDAVEYELLFANPARGKAHSSATSRRSTTMSGSRNVRAGLETQAPGRACRRISATGGERSSRRCGLPVPTADLRAHPDDGRARGP